MGGRQGRRRLAPLAMAAAAAHLGFVVLGALQVDLQKAGRLGQAVA